MQLYQRYYNLFHGKLRNLLTNQHSDYTTVLFKNRFHLGDSHVKDPEKEDVWKKLNLQLMKSQFEIENLDRQNEQQLRNRFQHEKSRLVHTLKNFQRDILRNEYSMNLQLSHFQLNCHKLSQEIKEIYTVVQKHDFNFKNAYIYVHYYQSFNEFVAQTEKYEHLTKLALIMQTFIKFKYLLTMNQVQADLSLINSQPHMYEDVWKRIKLIPFDEAKLNQDYNRLKVAMHTLVGILHDIDILNQYWIKSVAAIPISLAFGLLDYRKNILKSFKFFCKPDLKMIQFANKLEKGNLGRILQLPLPNIRTNKMIYIPSRGKFSQDLDIFTPNQDAISVRVLYNSQLPSLQSDEMIEQAMVHMHGGGLLFFSSNMTQNQTRLWANQTSMPVFSIDYRLAPKHPFPEAIYDCLQVYRFLTQQIHKYLNIRLKRTFICGDSAGGNLACSLTALILKNKLLIPRGMFLIYPSIDLRKNVYYPSRQYCLTDPVVWPSFVTIVTDSYLANSESTDNPLISPLLLTQQFVTGKQGDKSFPKQWPRTSIIVGLKDPLRDESLLLMQKMTRAGIDCECKVLQGFRHAFMNTEKIIRQSKITFTMSVQIINELIRKSRKQ